MDFSRLMRVFYPKRCVLCGKIVPIELSYCPCAGNTVHRVGGDFCVHCGYDRGNCSCTAAESVVLPFVTAPFIYSGRIRARLLDFKFGGEKRESEFFALEMSLRFAQCRPDVKADLVAAVPMTKAAVRRRGYNQSELLARGVAKRLFVPYEALLVKKGETESQHSLARKDRLKNLDGAFGLHEGADVRGKTVLLCDDIKTTGTTLKRCAEQLYLGGAKEVYCLCAAIADYVENIEF